MRGFFVHVYLNHDFGVVIGTNKDYQDDIQFSDFALAIRPDGKVVLQTVGDKNQPVTKDVDPALLRALLLGLLNTLDEI